MSCWVGNNLLIHHPRIKYFLGKVFNGKLGRLNAGQTIFILVGSVLDDLDDTQNPAKLLVSRGLR
jgi:hypothetical protein